MKHFLHIILWLSLSILFCTAIHAVAQRPDQGWATEAKVERVKDGDTVVVSITRTFALRLTHPNPEGKHFNTPENNTKEGRISTKFLKELVEKHKGQISIFIPANKPIALMDGTSFERIYGELWVGEERVTQIMLDKGYGKLK